jgi:hypothetical protein
VTLELLGTTELLLSQKKRSFACLIRELKYLKINYFLPQRQIQFVFLTGI